MTPDAPEFSKITPGFEAAHQEWMRQGAQKFRKAFQFRASTQFYETRYWKLVHQATLERDCFKCSRCGELANQVHHLHYDFLGEDHLHTESLVSICRSCHGIVEYGRIARQLASVIERRISLCRGFIENRKGCGDQNAVKVFSRLLEYRYRLANLERLYTAQTPYNNKPISRGSEEEEEFARNFQQKDGEYRRMAEEEVNSWPGTENEKAARIIPLLEREIEKCRQFSSKAVRDRERNG